jgi:hypothetical protein
MFLGSKVPHGADNLIADCLDNVRSFISQPYRPSRPVMGVSLTFTFYHLLSLLREYFP